MTEDPRLAPAIVAACGTDKGRRCEYPDCRCASSFRRRIIAALAAADKAAWRPMDSAPKDRTVLVAWIEPGTGERLISSAYWSGRWQLRDEHFAHFINPSHWQPLPPFPETPSDLAAVPAKEPASSA